eukprot:SAG11_NODE_5367_length_1581_cov_1.302969_1_plen_57_part_10
MRCFAAGTDLFDAARDLRPVEAKLVRAAATAYGRVLQGEHEWGRRGAATHAATASRG